jgi:hypothetical protein
MTEAAAAATLSSAERSPGITVTVPLSGPHRLEWMTQAVDSVPLDLPQIEAMHIVHPGGPWTWAPALRERLERHPKVRIIEFPDRLEVCGSLNRVTATAKTRWALLLPDDDGLNRSVVPAALEAAREALDSHVGLISFGWCYLMNGRYKADHVQRRRVADLVRYLPKCSATFVNVAHFQSINGFEPRYGSYSDLVTYAKLVHAFGAWTSDVPLGIYRMHEGQLSVEHHQKAYLPSVGPAIEALQALTPDPAERDEIAARLHAHASNVHSTAPHGWRRLGYWLRSAAKPPSDAGQPRLVPWRLQAA